MKKRVLALMLALVMALSLLPMMVAAEGEAQGGVNVENTEVAATPEQAGTTQPEESPAAVPEPTIEVPAELGAPMMAPAATVAANQLSALRVQIGFAIHPDYDYLLKNDGEDYNAPYTFDPTDYDYDFGAISVERATIDGMQKLNSLRFKMEAAEGAKVTIEYSNADGTRSSKEAFCVNHESNTDWVQLIKGENVVKLTVTPPTDSGLSETTYTLTLYVGEKPVVKDPAKVKVYFTFYDGKNYCFPVGRTEITAVEGTAAKDGMENAKAGHLVGGMDHSIKAGQVSVLDALLCAHEAVYGDAFTKDAMSSYFGGSSSFVSKIFGVDGSIGYAVNDRLPVGPKYDGYAINEYALSEGDDVYFFIYASPYWGDYLSYFDKKQLTVNAGEEITLKLSGYMAMEQMGTPGKDTRPITTMENIEGAEIDLLDEKYEFGDYLGLTDAEGKVTLKFDKAGTYYVSAIGESSTTFPITGPWCEITVNEAKPGDSDLNGMLVYNGTVANNTTVILKNSTDSFTTTNIFEWNKYEYDLGTVTDSSNQLRFKLKLPTGAKATLHYTDLSGNPATKDATNSSNGAWINCLKPGKNTVKVVITPPAGSTVGEKTYTINVNCQPSLTALALSANGNEAYLNPTFKNSVYDYSADISAAIETVLVTATPKDASCTVTYNGQTDSNVDIKDTDTIVVRVEKDGIYSEYTIKLNKKTAYTVKFETYPANAVVRLQDAKKAVLSPNADGVYENLMPDTDYTWVVTCKGYVTKTGTLNTPAQLINGVLSVILSAAPSSGLPNYSGEWPTFRNSKNNNALTNTVTPDSAATAELKWVKKYGEGWMRPVNLPIIVNNHVYIARNDDIFCLSKDSGEAVVSGKLAASLGGHGTNSMVYAEGMVFVQLDNGHIQALRADTLESLWVTESIGDQTISPITYYNGYIYTGTWGSETKEQNFACFSVTDEDPTNGFETKYATWLRPHAGGYYWVGAYVNDVCAVFGSDDGTSDSNSPTAVLYSVNPVTGSKIDTINDVKGDIRCCVVYDSGRVYFTTKGGYLYSVGLNSNGTFDHASIKSIQIGSMSTSTPVIYKGRLYVGCSGKGYDWDGDSGSGIAVVDVSGGKLEMIYKASTPGYPQAGPLVSTAFEAATGKVYVYTTYNKNPGGIYIIEDSAGQTEPSANNGDLYVPEKAYQQYCISTICADSEGTLYYKNDSGALIAVKSKAKLPEPPKPTPTPGDDDGYKPGWPGGSILGPGSNSNVPTPPTAEMPVTGGEDSMLPIALLIAGAVMLVALRRKKRV